MITDADIKKMKKVFVTKDDLDGMEKRQNKQFKKVNTTLAKIKKSLEDAVGYFDRQDLYHHKRLVDLEKQAGFEKYPVLSPIN